MRYILLFLAVIIPNIAYGATYTNTLLKDIVTTDPAENCLPSEYNDAERETRLVLVYTKGMGSSTASKTLSGTQTFHLGSSTTTITLPAASTIASATVGKEFLLHNTGAGTITVSVPMLNNAAGTITLSGNQSAYLFSDNVSYYQLRNSTEYNHIADSTDPHGATLTQTNLIATNGTITTFAATTANISSTLTVNGVTGIVDGDIPNTITLDNITQITSRAHDSITGTGTYSHTSIDSHIDDASDPHGASLTQTNLTATTGTVTTLYNTTFSGSVGTFTGTLGVNGISGIADSDIPNTITLDNITQITNRAHDNITGTGTNSHATIDTHLADTSDPHGASMTQTNISVTTGTVTTLYNATFSGNVGTFTGKLGVNGISGVVDSDIPNDITVTKAVTSWASGGTTGTGTMNLAAGSGMSLTPTYNSNGIGTITFTAAGTSSAGGWNAGATQTVTELSTKFGGVLNLNSNWISGDDDAEGIYILASGSAGIGTNTPATKLQVVGTVTATGFAGDINATSATIVGNTNFPSGIWNSSGNVGVGTTTPATTVQVVGTVTATGFVGNGSQLTGLTNSWANLTGIPTDNGSVSVTSGEGYIPVGGSDGLDGSWIPNTLAVHSINATSTASTFGTTTQYGDSVVTIHGTGTAALNINIAYSGSGTYTTSTMTGSTTPSPAIVTTSEYISDYQGYKAFDKILTEPSRWTTGATTTGWITYNYGTGNAHVVGSYDMAVESSANCPTEWQLRGSMDNTTWMTIDYRTGQTFPAGNPSREYGTLYTIATSTTAYQFYQINVLNATGGDVSIEEIRLLEKPSFNKTAMHVDSNGRTILGTDTPYSAYLLDVSAGSIVSGAFDVVSTESRKENIKPIKIKPDQLEAESKAKPIYIADKKPDWIAANEINYNYVGSDTATYVDTAAMEADYAAYIEIEWASDLSRNVYIEAVQASQQKYFWKLFDGIQAKSWNPLGMPNIGRKGFVVDEVPDEIKGDSKKTIAPMALIAYQTLVLQELKDSVVDIMQALKDLSSAGTFTTTTQAIVDRLEVMRTVP